MTRVEGEKEEGLGSKAPDRTVLLRKFRQVSWESLSVVGEMVPPPHPRRCPPGTSGCDLIWKGELADMKKDIKMS